MADLKVVNTKHTEETAAGAHLLVQLTVTSSQACVTSQGSKPSSGYEGTLESGHHWITSPYCFDKPSSILPRYKKTIWHQWIPGGKWQVLNLSWQMKNCLQSDMICLTFFLKDILNTKEFQVLHLYITTKLLDDLKLAEQAMLLCWLRSKDMNVFCGKHNEGALTSAHSFYSSGARGSAQFFSACSIAFQVFKKFAVAIRGDLLRWCSLTFPQHAKQCHLCPTNVIPTLYPHDVIRFDSLL
ncbi:uncharacterized protein LOC130356125 [Hyla sarda]|uniref:uncharacterized protein LOC130356125 n=1 Tax=Hyla sarda TaxID=327740 RepID=UPI0024C32701|nr:uncharacterized protein LOC130356125 [Hyla sarda]